MKKKLITLLLAFVTGTVIAFATEIPVSKKVLDAFQKEFPQATEVSWSLNDEYYRVEFSINSIYAFAFFSPEGDMLATARYISSLQLPLNLMSELKNDYGDYWITDLIEVNKRQGTLYYVTIENADQKIQLRAANGEKWFQYSKKTKV
jgi:hypothetical protein